MLFQENGADFGIGPFTGPIAIGSGAALADLENDGDTDLFVPNAAGVPDQLYRNEAGRLVEVGALLGVDSTRNNRVALFFDFNGDNRLDLLVGADCFMRPVDCADQRTLSLYEQKPDGSFADVSDSTGLTGLLPLTEAQHLGGFAAGDLDSDLDVVQSTVGGPLRLLENTSDNANHWLSIRPRSQTRNRRAIGATVRVRAGGLNMTRPITAGMSFLGQEPAEAFLGLGVAAQADSVIIEWPDGSQTSLSNVSADQQLDVMQNGCSEMSQACICGDYNEDGSLTSMDIGGVAMCANGMVLCDSSLVDTDGDRSTTALAIGGVVTTVAGNLPAAPLRCDRNPAP